MNLVVGLGPIGANTGLRLAERDQPVAGLDLDPKRAAAWGADSGADAYSAFEDVPWSEVDSVLIAVRLASQVEACLVTLATHAASKPLSIFVLTTLKTTDAERIFSTSHGPWRLFESPLSGGPDGARAGTMALFVAGPSRSPREVSLLSDIAGTVFDTEAYGQPAYLKLSNNTLAAYNAISTAAFMTQAAEHDIPPQLFLDVVNASSGQSWMSTNFPRFHYDVLFKDVRLFVEDLGALPVISLNETEAGELDALIEGVRRARFGDDAYYAS